MSDYTTWGSKQALGDLSPVGAVDSSWSHLQPLITPKQVRSRHLLGLTLTSGMRDLNGKLQAITDEDIADIIIEAVGLAEAELQMDIFPVQHVEKQAFDSHLFRSLGYFKLNHRPISSIESLTVTPANGVDIYVLPLDWIETALLSQGMISIIPINIATVGGAFVPAAASSTGGAAFFLSILGSRDWISSFWKVTYTTGFQDGRVPVIVNQLLGTICAMEILSMLAATYGKVNSHSTGIDALSQSVSGPGAQIFKQRMEELAGKRGFLVNKIKSLYGMKFLVGEV